MDLPLVGQLVLVGLDAPGRQQGGELEGSKLEHGVRGDLRELLPAEAVAHIVNELIAEQAKSIAGD